MADITCAGTCTLVIEHVFVLPLLQLDSLQAAEIGWAIISVWVVAWGVRMIVRAMRADAVEPGSES